MKGILYSDSDGLCMEWTRPGVTTFLELHPSSQHLVRSKWSLSEMQDGVSDVDFDVVEELVVAHTSDGLDFKELVKYAKII